MTPNLRRNQSDKEMGHRVSLEQAQERFAKAMEAVERALATVQKRQDQQQQAVNDLTDLKARHAALAAEHEGLRKSFDALRKQQQATVKRLDGAITSLQEVLGA